jgi:S-formylglutathione hydrolase FrmB
MSERAPIEKRILRVPHSSLLLACVGVLTLLFSLTAVAQSRADCSTIKSEILHRAVPYCVVLPPSFSTDKTKQFPVLYYLHGIGDNEQSLINTGGWNTYDDLLKQNKVGEFIMAAPAGFQTFFINSRDGRVKYEDFFLGEFMPAIEKKYRGGHARDERAVVGISMGGFGALHLGFAHPNLFVSTAGIMPALMQKLPASFGSDAEEQLMKRVFGDASDSTYYDRVSVFTFAEKRQVAELRRMKIYFATGNADDYNFEIGGEALHKILERRGIPHEWHLDPGRHSAGFALQHFGPALEFTSKAFGLTK